MPESNTQSSTEEYTLIIAECLECNAIDGITIIEHPQDSLQQKAVSDAHQTMADEHSGETGHETQIETTFGSPKSVTEKAKSAAHRIENADPDDFTNQ